MSSEERTVQVNGLKYVSNTQGTRRGLTGYDPGQTKNCRAVFEQADAQVREEKKLLKSPGAVTRL